MRLVLVPQPCYDKIISYMKDNMAVALGVAFAVAAILVKMHTLSSKDVKHLISLKP